MSTLENKEDKMLDVKAKKTVYATGKSPDFVKGQTITVSIPVAEKLVRSGKAAWTSDEAIKASETTDEAPVAKAPIVPNPFEKK